MGANRGRQSSMDRTKHERWKSVPKQVNVNVSDNHSKVVDGKLV